MSGCYPLGVDSEPSWWTAQVLESDCLVQNLTLTFTCCVSWPSHSLWIFVFAVKIRTRGYVEPAFSCLWETLIHIFSQLSIQWCNIASLKVVIGGRLYTMKISRKLQSRAFFLFTYWYINIHGEPGVKHWGHPSTVVDSVHWNKLHHWLA